MYLCPPDTYCLSLSEVESILLAISVAKEKLLPESITFLSTKSYLKATVMGSLLKSPSLLLPHL